MRPTEFFIGEAGELFRSKEWEKEKESLFEEIQEKVTLKTRTLRTNYASTLSTTTYLFSRFAHIIGTKGYSFEDFIELFLDLS